MKKRLLLAVFLTATMVSSALAGVNVSVGIPVLPPTVVIETAPRFIYSPPLGFHVSVGAPYDIVYLGNSYYLYNNGYYYRSSSYNGPWVGVESRRLPKGLRKHRYEDIRRYRDREFHRYERDRDHYRGRWHNPGEHRGGEHHGDDHRGGEHRGGEGRH
jgi:hypothetical protein